MSSIHRTTHSAVTPTVEGTALKGAQPESGPRVKVVHLTTTDISLRFLLLPQLESIVALGAEAIGMSGPGPWRDDLERASIRFVSLDASTRRMSLIGDIRTAIQLWRALRKERPQILHTHNPKPGVYGRLIGRLAGVPVVVNTVHGLYATPDDAVLKKLTVYTIEAVVSRFSHAELIQSREDYELINRRRLAPRGHVRLLGNGVDLTRFDPARLGPSSRQTVRRELGIEDSQTIVLMVGRLVAEKGYIEYLTAAETLNHECVFLAVGPHDIDKPDALDPELIKRAKEQGGVHFLGMREDMDSILAASDIFVLPSYREGFPRAAMEAAAMGLPVIATDIRGCREVVEDGVNGLLIPVGDAVALADAISRLIEDPGLRSTMGREGRRKAESDFDERRVVDKVLDTYRAAAEEGGHEQLAKALGPRGADRVRRARTGDAPALARLHGGEISDGFLASLGQRFLTLLYSTLTDWPDALVFVSDPGGSPVGFVAGVVDTGAFYRHFLRRHFLAAAIAVIPAILKPSNLRRAWETLRYGQKDSASAELLAMSVKRGWQGRGIGRRLGTAFVTGLQDRGITECRVVVGEANQSARAVYTRVGFLDDHTIELHSGERSKVMSWSLSR